MEYADFSTLERVNILPLTIPEQGKVLAYDNKVLVSDGKEWIDITEKSSTEMSTKQLQDLIEQLSKLDIVRGGVSNE